MSTDPAVLEALRSALTADPANHGVRRHLAELELLGGDAGAALEHCRRLLGEDPGDGPALALAARAARAAGDPEAAGRYEAALGVDRPAPPGAPLRAAHEPPPVEDDDAEAGPDVDGVQRPSVRLADVGGLEDVKARIERAFLAPLRDPRLQALYGSSMRGGLLLWGPPGCGKTLVARALAGELGARFLSVGLADVLSPYIGDSERALSRAFDAARRAAPCVLFLDEVDALGQRRANLRGSAARSVVSQLLTELDGAGDRNDGLFVLAATNHPWDVDSALRRPGRLERSVLVLPPDAPAREAILRAALAERPVEAGVDVAALAGHAELRSGADLRRVVDAAAELAVERAVRTGDVGPITSADLRAALADVPVSVRPWFATAVNYATFAQADDEADRLLAYAREHRLDR